MPWMIGPAAVELAYIQDRSVNLSLCHRKTILLTAMRLVQPSTVPVLQTELEPELEPEVGVATARRGRVARAAMEMNFMSID